MLTYLFFTGANFTKVCSIWTSNFDALGRHYFTLEYHKRCNCLPDCATIQYDIETSYDTTEVFKITE